MGCNENAWVKDLLSWRGDDLGGVRVPFAAGGGNPLRDRLPVIETPLIRKLRRLAEELSAGSATIRSVFLVGGPGNGKSEAVEFFGRELDAALGLGGDLVEVLSGKFQPDPLVKRVVQVLPEDLGDPGRAEFAARVGRLVIVQDASATNSPDADAAAELVGELGEMLSSRPAPVFLSCINRGVLAQALAMARSADPGGPVDELLEALVSATALVPREAQDQPDCWPLGMDGAPGRSDAACWPMDAQSLLLDPAHGGLSPSPVQQVLAAAVDEDQWEVEGRCSDCRCRHVCPFRQNASWLREAHTQASLLDILRLAELSSRQRWNFRNVFSLIPELLVGDWDDFGNEQHPCSWVAKMREVTRDERDSERTAAAEGLVDRLYPHALNPVRWLGDLPEDVRATAQRKGYAATIAHTPGEAVTSQGDSYIRDFLRSTIAPRLDPVLYSPHEADAPGRLVEDSFSNGTAQGVRDWREKPEFRGLRPAGSERLLLRFLVRAEEEWDALDKESSRAAIAVGYLRAAGASLAKRSIGARLGSHGAGPQLNKYREILRDPYALSMLTEELIRLLGGNDIQFDAAATFGQPRSRAEQLFSIESRIHISDIAPAPQATEARPAHDLPMLRVADHLLPLTYDLYEALLRRRAGSPEGSLPANVQASIDRIRHLHAGVICRDADYFARRQGKYELKSWGRLVPSGEDVRLRPEV